MTSLLEQVLLRLDRGDAPGDRWPDAGGEYWGLCPFHADNHAGSFSLNKTTGLYNCYACEAKGNLRQLARHLGIDTEEATAGITLDEYAEAKRIPPGFLAKVGVTQEAMRWGKSRIPILRMPYYDEDGAIVAVRRRLFLHKGAEDNRFRWRKGDKARPYGLWLLEQMRPRGWILLVEGESDCHTAWLHKIPALGIPGASSWHDAWAEHLEGLEVFAWHEPDAGGDTFIARLRRSLPDAKVIVPPEGAKDISELYIAGQDVVAAVEELKAKAKRLDEFAAGPATFNLTDYGNTERLVAQYGSQIHYDATAGRWYVWDGRRWARDVTNEIERMAKNVVRNIYREAADEADPDRRAALSKWALRSEAQARILAMIALADSEPGVAVTPGHFDADPWMFNALNGTVDLRDGSLRPHDPDDMISKLAPVVYDPDAKSEVWDRFLEEATGGDGDLQRFLARAAGYTMTGLTSEEVLFFLHGPAAAGKSTFVEALKATMGDYAMTADFETFLQRSFVGGIRNDIADLAGARFVLSIEVDEGKKLAEGLIKLITGGDTVKARHLYREGFEFVPQFSLWLVANHAPRVRDDDAAMWRRILRVPFEHVVPVHLRDSKLKAFLRDCERGGPAILAWLVRGCREWRHIGLAIPLVIERATAEYRHDMDPLVDFVQQYCVITPLAQAETGQLREAYERWGSENGLGPRDLVRGKAWGERLRSLGCVPHSITVDGQTRRFWLGIGLKASQDDAYPTQPELFVADQAGSGPAREHDSPPPRPLEDDEEEDQNRDIVF